MNASYNAYTILGPNKPSSNFNVGLIDSIGIEYYTSPPDPQDGAYAVVDACGLSEEASGGALWSSPSKVPQELLANTFPALWATSQSH